MINSYHYCFNMFINQCNTHFILFYFIKWSCFKFFLVSKSFDLNAINQMLANNLMLFFLFQAWNEWSFKGSYHWRWKAKMGGPLQSFTKREPSTIETWSNQFIHCPKIFVLRRKWAYIFLHNRSIHILHHKKVQQTNPFQLRLRTIRPLQFLSIQRPIPWNLDETAERRFHLRPGGEHTAQRDKTLPERSLHSVHDRYIRH